MRRTWEHIKDLAKEFYLLLDTPFAHVGNTAISINSLLYFILTILLLFYVAKKARFILEKKILSRTNVDEGISHSIGTIVRYLIIILGLVIIFQSAGLDLSALGVVAGALGVGIGFGLQNITNNFISGLIILFERPIKVGDRVEVGEVRGDVVKIAARATTIITNDNISMIIPNSEFISSNVTNWSHNNRMVRFRIPVGVSYNEEPEVIRGLLMEVAKGHEGVLKSPAPSVAFTDFGDSSLDFELWIWTIKYTSRPTQLKSDLYYAIFQKFKENNIEIPFPQRDLHLRSGLEFLKKDPGTKPRSNGKEV